VALKHAPVNTVRLFEAFDFMSAAETRLQAHNLVLLNALRVGLPPGTGDALSRLMLKKNEKLIAHGTPGLTSGPTGLIRVVTAADFAAVVLASTQPVLVEFWTSWSRPCQVLDSVLQELAGHWGGKVQVVKVNADDSLDLSLCYDIQSVPTLLCFVAGSPSFRIVGTATREALEAKINAEVKAAGPS
jgi:thioredoxin 1